MVSGSRVLNGGDILAALVAFQVESCCTVNFVDFIATKLGNSFYVALYRKRTLH